MHLARPHPHDLRLPVLLAAAVFLALVLAACGSDTAITDGSTDADDAEVATTTSIAASGASQTGGESTTTQADRDEPRSPAEVVGPGPANDGVLLGMSVGMTRAEREPRWRMLEDAAGRSYDIGHVFHAWDMAIPTPDDLMHIEDGRLLMISWNGTDTIEIQNGGHDEWIRAQARATRDLGVDVLFRWLWEMDGRRRITWVHSPEDFVGAWNHVRTIFAEEGATNAQFVWCPNEFLFWNGGDPEPWYPGDDAVDWLCADGYNWAESRDSEDWVDLVDIFGDFYDWATPKGKPIVIAETGIAETDPGAKAEWLRQVPRLLRDELPEIDAFVYFDKDFRELGHADWRLDTSPDALEAWVEISNDPWLHPTAG